MTGSAGWPQPSWTGRGEVWVGSEPAVGDVARTAVLVAALNAPVLVLLGQLVERGWLRVAALAAFAAIVLTLFWWRRRPMLGVALVIESLALLLVTSNSV